MRRDIFQAIADPTRRAVISLIMVQSMTPNAIAAQFQTSRQAISKHIRVLNECGLLTMKNVGRERQYQIDVTKLREVDEWLQPFRALWEQRHAALDQVLLAMQNDNSTGTVTGSKD